MKDGETGTEIRYEKPKDFRSEAAKALRDARESRGYSQSHIARLTGVKQAAISRWESGESNLTCDVINKAADMYDMTPHLTLVPNEEKE